MATTPGLKYVATTTLSCAVVEWTRIFPKNVTKSYISSSTFIKQLTTLAISTIAYTRELFPLDNFVEETLGGQGVRILKKNCTNKHAQFLSTTLVQAFSAFDEKYLRRLVLCLYNGDNKLQDNLIEYWSFEYAYNENGLKMTVGSKDSNRDINLNNSNFTLENIRKHTVYLLRTLIVLMKRVESPAPSDCDISLRLYYNSNAPVGYQPSGFFSIDEEQDHLELTDKEYSKNEVTKIKTPYHNLRVRSYYKEDDDSSCNVHASANAPRITQIENELATSERNYRNLDSSEVSIYCPCNLEDYDEDVKERGLLTCHYCNTKQHAACYGVLQVNVARILHHCCVRCSDEDKSRTPTDVALYKSNDQIRKKVCILRRIMEWCLYVESINIEDIMVKFNIPKHMALEMLAELHKHRVIQKAPRDHMTISQEIDQRNLKTLMSKYFLNQEINIIDQLIAESLSQEPNADPVGKILGPSETENLQNTLKTSQVLKPVQPKTNEYATLNEYKAAIMADDDSLKDFVSPVNRSKENVGFRKKKIVDTVGGGASPSKKMRNK
ncbi:hypothetical protein K1T71_005319 [Dendrolimus kikuchii]|uniref:Uncharacterized protein n=1 Tax=Dendrolimus kikuchii TaxID=765133 RepID=A0ACC1D7R5_9NEOP|nr:hypothetical protein K1T71_005319 [Dendrolimus kikuchii]